MAYEIKNKKPSIANNGFKVVKKPSPYNKNPETSERDHKPKTNRQKPIVKIKASTIKKKKSLKYVSISNIPNKRMYRLSIILGSTVLCDTFTIDEPFATSVVKMRDSIAISYSDLTKLLDKSISGGMLPRPFTKIWEATHKGIMEGENNDVIHNLTRDVFTPGPNDKDAEFPSIVSYSIAPGNPAKNVTKRVVIRLNYVTNPNFEPKKKDKDIEVVKKDEVIEYKSKPGRKPDPYKIVKKPTGKKVKK